MFRSAQVVGTAGRVGSAVAARLRERGVELREDGGAELRLLCVPDRAIAEVAAAIEPGPWVAHVSGATSVTALDPHVRRFCVHPLQTIVRGRGPEQLDGASAAVTAELPEALEAGFQLAWLLGLEPFALRDEDKPLYHAAAALASNHLVTLYRIAGSLFEQVDAPRRGLVPLMTRTIENEFELTGPAARGDWTTVEAHLSALGERRPELVGVYRALAEAAAA
jgi:predicted short-subunit dehydrogenase-like oxidoreductase (DUF2520 family)